MNKLRPSKSWFAGDLQFGLFTDDHNTREELFLTMWDDVVTRSDDVYLIGHTVGKEQANWYSRLREMPGNKILLLGDQDRNRYSWYEKFGFKEVVPHMKFKLIPVYLGSDQRENGPYYYGNVMVSFVPAFQSLCAGLDKALPIASKLERHFDYYSCILNVHGLTNGKAKERHNTCDVTRHVIGNQLVNLDQLLSLKVFRNVA